VQRFQRKLRASEKSYIQREFLKTRRAIYAPEKTRRAYLAQAEANGSRKLSTGERSKPIQIQKKRSPKKENGLK